MASDNYIKTAHPDIVTRVGNTLQNMSDFLGDIEGKIRDKQVKFLVRNITASPVRELLNLTSPDIQYSEAVLGKEVFTPTLTVNAYNLLSKLQNLDSKYVYTPIVPEDFNLSPLLAHAKNISTEALEYICYLYLETFSLYTALVEYSGSSLLSVTTSDLDTLIQNCRFILIKIGDMGNTESVYEVAYVVKRIHRSILFIRKNVLPQ